MGRMGGSATLNGAAATFNRVDVRRPSLALNANAATVNITDLSAFTEKGILEATATVSACATTDHGEPERARRAAQHPAAVGLARAAGERRWQYSADCQRECRRMSR